MGGRPRCRPRFVLEGRPFLDEKNSTVSCCVCMGQSLSHLLGHSISSTQDRRPFLRSKELRNEIYGRSTEKTRQLPMAASTIAEGLEGCRLSQPLPAVNRPHFRAPTERTPSSSRNRSAMALTASGLSLFSLGGENNRPAPFYSPVARLSLCRPTP